MTSKSRFPIDDIPFVDEIFLNSPLCQICEYANLFGGVCSLLLNRRVPSTLIIKDSQIMSCSSHRNWVQSLDETLSTNEMPENIDDDLVSFRDFIQRHKNHNKKAG
ncbi:MAG: hypothetical protein ACW97X_08380 [Candidatus Hodarchaeales archaeon]|jgi:hypothetical protein